MIPSDISGLQFWVKADQIGGLADNDPISTWADQSGNGRDITATLAARPTYQTNEINGLPVARFDGSANQMDGASVVTGTTARSIFIVLKSVGTALAGIISLNRAAAPADGAEFVMSPDISVRVSNGNRIYTVNTGTTAFRVLTMTAAAISDVSAVSAYLDGTALSQSSTVARAMNTGTTGIRVGASPSVGAQWGGDIAEIIIYSTVLSTGDRAGIHSYIQDKYAITVSDYVAGTTPLTFTGTSDLNA